MNTPTQIQAAMDRQRERNILQRYDAGKTMAEIQHELGIPRPELEKMILAHRSRRASGEAQTYARAVNAGAECVWAMPAPASVGAISADLARAAFEINQVIAEQGANGNRVMICIAVLPPDEPITMRGL